MKVALLLAGMVGWAFVIGYLSAIAGAKQFTDEAQGGVVGALGSLGIKL